MDKREVALAEAYRLLTPGMVVLIASRREEKNNVMAASWQMPVSKEPPLVSVAVAKKHLTAEYIQATGVFTVNVPGYGILTQVHFCGTVSGRRVQDKLAEAGLTPVPGQQVAAPLIKECLAGLECRVWNTYDGGDHYIFVGQVVRAEAASEVFEGSWHLREEKNCPVHHLGGPHYYLPGTPVAVKMHDGRLTVEPLPR
ncbi:flavin reductase family protein [Desulfothermobacter acidiphilus]|uniref:flavin reductase family protein n=1 Tax=Desulfothermobacter acidiphilus TaxID=1938353 RepID=UPI003F8B84A1